jgi:S-layer homology domain
MRPKPVHVIPVAAGMRTRRHAVLIALMLGAAIAFPLGVLASHQFSDVPNSNQYHADIDALADSGVTTGCGGGKYCPADYVTREQMAAFMNRLGALGPGKTPVVNADKVDGKDSTQFLRSDVAVAGHYNCAGETMPPLHPNVAFFVGPQGIWLTSGSGSFACRVLLPNGATINSMRAYVSDASAAGGATCALVQYDITGQTEVTNLGIASSGDAAQPGFTTLEDDTLGAPVVDNALSTYVGRCHLGAPMDVKLFTFGVEYTVTGPAIP